MHWVTRWVIFCLLTSPIWGFTQPTIELYSDVNYQGSKTLVHGDLSDVSRALSQTRFGSLKVRCTCSVILFSETSYHGTGIVVRQDVADLGSTDLAGRIGSLQVHTDQDADGSKPTNDIRPSAVAESRTSEPSERANTFNNFSKKGVVLFAEKQFKGKGLALYEDESNVLGRFGEDISPASIVVPEGFQAYLYPKTRFRGRPIHLKADQTDIASLKEKGFAVGSVRVSWLDPNIPDEKRPYITLFRGKQFSGKSERFFGDDHDLSDNPIGDNTIQSVRVPRGCTLVLYENKYFRGRAIAFKEGHSNLALTVLGAEQVSSFRIQWDQ